MPSPALTKPRRRPLRLAKLTRGRRIAPVGGTKVLDRRHAGSIRRSYDLGGGLRGQVWSLGPKPGQRWLVVSHANGSPNRWALATVKNGQIVRWAYQS